ncbi:MAG TPA: hypothetical protein VF630_10570 [Hymenobacter sp.]|jgi:hypothetical protein
MSRTSFRRLTGLLTGALLLLKAGTAQAQMAPDSAQLAVKLALGRLLGSTYEVELERRYGRRFSFSLLPRVVAGQALDHSSSNGSPFPNRSNDRIRGYGLGFGPRHYLPNTGTEGTGLAGLYIGLKAEYQHLRFTYEQEGWGEDLAADGLRYYTFRARNFTETINRYGGAFVLGYQCQILHPRLRFDGSASLNGLSSRSSAGPASRYRSSPTDYGHSGSFLTFGLSLGFVVK